MKDSTWTYVKDCALFSTHFVIEVGLIPIHEINGAFERTRKKLNKK